MLSSCQKAVDILHKVIWKKENCSNQELYRDKKLVQIGVKIYIWGNYQRHCKHQKYTSISWTTSYQNIWIFRQKRKISRNT